MATLTIRRFEDDLKAKLRRRAAAHRRSMEEEARHILRSALAADEEAPGPNLADAIRQRLAPLGGVELQIPEREPMREPPLPE